MSVASYGKHIRHHLRIGNGTVVERSNFLEPGYLRSESWVKPGLVLLSVILAILVKTAILINNSNHSNNGNNSNGAPFTVGVCQN